MRAPLSEMLPEIAGVSIFTRGLAARAASRLWGVVVVCAEVALPGAAPVNPNANPATAPNALNPAGTNGQQQQQPPQTPVINVPGMPTPTQ